MGEKNIGISQQTLVSNQELNSKGQRFPQYLAAIAATLGALACGTVLGWSSSAGTDGVDLAKEYEMDISASEFSWIGSMPNLGAAAICVPIGLLMDVVGRKRGMLMLIVPFTVGWALVIWANSVVMFYIGRFLLGLSGGAFCVAAPIYTAEIAESEIRGSLGSYFQLMLTIGILFSYVVGSLTSMYVLSLVSAVIPLVFFAVFFFMPETPIYYLLKNNEDQARASLVRLRGTRYDVEQELLMAKEARDNEARNRVSFLQAIKSKVAINGLIIAFGLMLFQQLSGVNAIIFYTGTFFGSGGNISSETSTIIVGVMQVVAVFTSTLIVDKLGRKILLIISEIAMTLGTLILGTYFYFESTGTELSAVSWIPLVAVCLFILMFNFGFGPIPWMMVGEIFAPQIKGTAGSSACLFNWLMAFVVTRFYGDLLVALKEYGTFWMFSAICALGIVFVIFVVRETKGKSLEQIQTELGAKPAPVSDAEKA